MPVTLQVEPIKNIYGFDSKVNSDNQLRYVFSVDVLEGNDSVVLEVLDASGTINLLGTDVRLSYVVPTGIQVVTIDLADVLFHVMTQLEISYIRFIVSYTHVSNAGVEPIQLASQIVVTLSNLSVHLPNGSNMADYLFKNRGLPPFPIPAALPLTPFDRSLQNTVWRGFKKTLSFIADAEIPGRLANDLIASVKILDGGRNVIFTAIDQPILATDSIKTIIINEEGGPLTDTSFPSAKWVSIEVTSPSFPDMPLMIDYLFKIKEPCRPSVMIGWINDRGATEHWIFQRDFGLTEEASRGVIFEIPLIEDISSQQGLIGRASREEESQILLLSEDNVTRNQIRVLKGIKKSRLVWVALDRNDTNRIQAVAFGDYSTEINVRNDLSAFQTQLKLPKNVEIEEILTYANVG